MGTYLNPGNSAFAGIRNDIYIDKSGLIELINQSIETPRRLTCISRPRRFGKSFAAQMLCAYYDRSCDSSGLFGDLAISRTADYRTHLNHYDVIYLNMTAVLGETSADDFVAFIRRNIVRELVDAYPSMHVLEHFGATLASAVQASGSRFIMIIDEWDAPIRETPKIGQEYLTFLRALFKINTAAADPFAAVYMTGILPIRKDGAQPAIPDFREYSMLRPGPFASYVGFTVVEVRTLCAQTRTDFHEMKRWYDGYCLRGAGSVYNPYSVIKAVLYRDYDAYWTETSSAASLMHYISRNADGLRRTIAELTGGADVPVDTKGFSNDLTTFHGRDDVLTLLIHLGYLAYDEITKKARIPNEEVRLEFVRAVHMLR